jgi:hypothetical protein
MTRGIFRVRVFGLDFSFSEGVSYSELLFTNVVRELPVTARVKVFYSVSG